MLKIVSVCVTGVQPGIEMNRIIRVVAEDEADGARQVAELVPLLTGAGFEINAVGTANFISGFSLDVPKAK